MDSKTPNGTPVDINVLNLMTVPVRADITGWKYLQHTALMDHMQAQIAAKRLQDAAVAKQMSAITKCDLGEMAQATEQLNAATAQFDYLDAQLSDESLYTSTIAAFA